MVTQVTLVGGVNMCVCPKSQWGGGRVQGQSGEASHAKLRTRPFSVGR